MIEKPINAVAEFHKAFNQGHTDTNIPSNAPLDIVHLRHRLMAEENDEYLEACNKEDIPGIADALGDQLYILCGTILKHGMQYVIENVFEEIHRSNMSKLGPDGKPILREDGKILKGPGYFKPDISKAMYGNNSES